MTALRRFGWSKHLLEMICMLLLIQDVLSIWPLPKRCEHGSSVLWLDPDFAISNVSEEQSLWYKLQNLMQNCIWRTIVDVEPTLEVASRRKHSRQYDLKSIQKDIFSNTYVPWKFHPRASKFEPDVQDSRSATIKRVNVKQVSSLRHSNSLEAYILVMNVDGKVEIQVHHYLGIVRALSTFKQLFSRHSKSSSLVYTDKAPLVIEDAPSFEHRGLNLDISRNIITPQDAIRTIQAMAFNKFNRLHLHASDAQSWPLEIPSIPHLAVNGAYHPSQIWSASDLNDVQSFGKVHGVEVYVEIDMPGHTASIRESFPELITSYNRKPWEEYSAQPPAGQLKLESKEVDGFIASLLDDLLPRVRPFSSLFHLGGDEITASAYNKTPFELKPSLQDFVDRAYGIVQRHGLKPVVWEEQILDYNLSLPASTIVQAWRGSRPGQSSALEQLVGRGYQVLFGSNDYWYLDCGHGSWIDPDPTNPKSKIGEPFMDYCAPLKNWRQVYSYKPLSEVPSEKRHLVLGGEVHMWAEQTDGINLDRNLWPRAAAAGEILWSGGGILGENTTRRLADMRERLVAMGVASEPVQVTWCLMHPGNCVA